MSDLETYIAIKLGLAALLLVFVNYHLTKDINLQDELDKDD